MKMILDDITGYQFFILGDLVSWKKYDYNKPTLSGEELQSVFAELETK